MYETHPRDGSREVISLLFGPQGSMTPDTLQEMRSFLQEIPDLKFLSRAISELPTLWPDILDACPQLDRISGRAKLTDLRNFFQGGEPSINFSPVDNLLLSPLGVISQIIEFWKLSHGFCGERAVEGQFTEVQGFCLGFLTAIAVSCSKNEAQFQDLCGKAVRLALCMGALVDSDALKYSEAQECAVTIAVRWKSSTHLQHLEHTSKLYPRVSEALPQKIHVNKLIIETGLHILYLRSKNCNIHHSRV
jgi:hypothetical protein